MYLCLQVMMGLELTDKSPFKVIYLHGLVRDGEVSTNTMNAAMKFTISNVLHY
jgi:valyl-tRNA synthetase